MDLGVADDMNGDGLFALEGFGNQVMSVDILPRNQLPAADCTPFILLTHLIIKLMDKTILRD